MGVDIVIQWDSPLAHIFRQYGSLAPLFVCLSAESLSATVWGQDDWFLSLPLPPPGPFWSLAKTPCTTSPLPQQSGLRPLIHTNTELDFHVRFLQSICPILNCTSKVYLLAGHCPLHLTLLNMWKLYLIEVCVSRSNLRYVITGLIDQCHWFKSDKVQVTDFTAMHLTVEFYHYRTHISPLHSRLKDYMSSKVSTIKYLGVSFSTSKCGILNISIPSEKCSYQIFRIITIKLQGVW